MIRFSHTIFYVHDVLKAINFYEAAFGLKIKFLHESQAYAEFATEGVTLAFASEELGSLNFPEGYLKNSLKKSHRLAKSYFLQIVQKFVLNKQLKQEQLLFLLLKKSLGTNSRVCKRSFWDFN